MMQRDHIPRRFNLRWHAQKKAIQIDVHRDCLEAVKPIDSKSPWVQMMIKTHGLDDLFDSFSGNLRNETFGFNGTIRRTNDKGDYIGFLAQMPKIRIETNQVCDYCAGTGKRLEEYASDEKCLYCSGSTKGEVHDWRAAFTTLTSLSLLFNILDVDSETSAREQQHLSIHLMAEHGPHGSSLGGCFGIIFTEYLYSGGKRLEEVILPKAVQTMKTAHATLWTMKGFDAHRFRGAVNEGFLTLDCPGEACGIHHSGHERRDGYGREFSCHNVDSPLQSLTLLAGLASLVGDVDDAISH